MPYHVLHALTYVNDGRKLCYDGYSYIVKATKSTRIRWECSKRKAFCYHGAVTTDLQVKYFSKYCINIICFKCFIYVLTLYTCSYIPFDLVR